MSKNVRIYKENDDVKKIKKTINLIITRQSKV